jgi:hypothetical protein
MPRRFPLVRRLGVVLLPLALAAGLPALPAVAQQNAPQMPQAGTGAGGYSQEKLQSYAAAVMKVQEIDRAWQPRIQQAEDQQQAEAMTTEATNQMIGEIEAQGLSVQEYNAITQAAEQDQQLYDHIMTLLAQAPR